MPLIDVLTYSNLSCDVVTHDPLGSHEVILGHELTLIIQRTAFLHASLSTWNTPHWDHNDR